MTEPAGADRGGDADWRAFGQLVFDTSKPDGTPRKLLDVSGLNSLGWTSKNGFRKGIAKTYADFLKTSSRLPDACQGHLACTSNLAVFHSASRIGPFPAAAWKSPSAARSVTLNFP